MSINFPDAPTLNQVFTVGTRTWIWNGSIWISVAAGFTGSIGFTGSAGFTGSQGVTGFTGSSASGVPDFINMMQGTI